VLVGPLQPCIADGPSTCPRFVPTQSPNEACNAAENRRILMEKCVLHRVGAVHRAPGCFAGDSFDGDGAAAALARDAVQGARACAASGSETRHPTDSPLLPHPFTMHRTQNLWSSERALAACAHHHVRKQMMAMTPGGAARRTQRHGQRQRPSIMVLALALAAALLPAAAHAYSYSQMLANTTTIPLHLLENPFAASSRGPKGSRQRSLQATNQWDEWKRIGRYTEIANPDMPGVCALLAQRIKRGTERYT